MTPEPGTGPAAFDPFELPDTIQLWTADDPYPYLAAARRDGPVRREWPLPVDIGTVDEGSDPWFNVLGHDEVMAVLRDDETYSSTVLAEMMGPMLGHTMIAMDDPEHRAHRALVAPAFRPKLLARWEHDLVRRVIDELIDSFAPLGRADLVRRLTFAFPVRVIARILGLPERDSQQFQRWSIELISIIVNWDRGIAASNALRDYFAARVAERRDQPRDDLISELVDTEVDGQRLSDEEIFAFLRLLLPAGVETTYRSFGNLLFALLTHPDQLEEVTRKPELRAAAIEEGLRWEPPLVMIPRQCVRGARLGGVDIPAGGGLNVFIGSANRDAGRYVEPDRFDIHRTPLPHASFGSGPHMCLGMHLARMETRVALDAVLERLHDLRLDPEAPRPAIVGSVFRSPDALPVCFNA
ncbi:MAG: cytochrome P450 [Actinobacteria bacterium]|nr:MAG: cytochrome P450 [Actinomycetota bacterium]